MPPKRKKTAAEAPPASNINQGKSSARTTKQQAPTAATSRPRRAAKASDESKAASKTAPEPIPRPAKRKRTMSIKEQEDEVVKKKEKTKKHVIKLKAGEKTATTADDGPEKLEGTTAAVASARDTKLQDGDGKSFWLMKAEPLSRMEKGKDVKFSIDDLMAAKEPESWDGVRNPAARNNMRAMKQGDLAFFYHSNCPTPGIAGTMAIVKEHSVDQSAHDPEHPYYDPKSSEENPKWSLVHVEFRRKFPHLVTLKELQQHSKTSGSPLENLQTLKQSRLSVSKVSREEWVFINELADSKDEKSGTE